MGTQFSCEMKGLWRGTAVVAAQLTDLHDSKFCFVYFLTIQLKNIELYILFLEH